MLMLHPVTAGDGRAYEKDSLLEQMRTGWNTTPPTNEDDLKLNRPLQQAIQQHYMGNVDEMRKIFSCGLHLGIMAEPVTDFTTGETYEASWYYRWLEQPREGFYKSPERRSANASYEPNTALRRAICEYRLQNPSDDKACDGPPPPPGLSVAIGGVCSGCGRSCQVSLSLGITNLGAEPELLSCTHCSNSFWPAKLSVWPGSKCMLSVTYCVPGQKRTRRTDTIDTSDSFQQRDFVPVGASLSFAKVSVWQ